MLGIWGLAFFHVLLAAADLSAILATSAAALAVVNPSRRTPRLKRENVDQ